MAINFHVKIEKKDLWLMAAIMVFLVGVGYVIAYGSGQPTVHGHDAGEIEGIGVTFGEWQTDDSGQIGGAGAALVVDTVYQAATDGFVCVYDSQPAKATIAILTDSINPPITIRARDERGSVCAPVRENDYWEVTHNGLYKELTNVYWLPF